MTICAMSAALLAGCVCTDIIDTPPHVLHPARGVYGPGVDKPLTVRGQGVLRPYSGPYPPVPTRLYEAVELAGGLTRFADCEIQLFRLDLNGKQWRIHLCYDRVLTDPLSPHNLLLYPGDIVEVHLSPY